MDRVDTITNDVNPAEASREEDFELKMLDCGTNYQMESASVSCLSCFCGSGCFCSGTTS